MKQTVFFLLAALGLFMTTLGCIDSYEPSMSWSDDERYLIFVDHDKHALWIWDMRVHQPYKLIEEGVRSCRFLPSSHKILFDRIPASEEAKLKPQILDPTSGELKECDTGPYDESMTDCAADGTVVKVVQDQTGETGGSELWLLPKSQHLKPIRLVSSKSEICWPRLDPEGLKVLYLQSTGDTTVGLQMCDLDNATTRSLVQSDREMPLWPLWLDKDRFCYISVPIANDKDQNTSGSQPQQTPEDAQTGSLMVYNLADGSIQTICGLISPTSAFHSITSDKARRRLAFTRLIGPFPEDGLEPSLEQLTITVCNLEDHSLMPIENEPLGADYPVLSPTGRYLAYLAPMAGGSGAVTYRIADLRNGKRWLIARDMEEKLVARAERLAMEGRSELAAETYEHLTLAYPETRFKDVATTRILTLKPSPKSALLEALPAQ